MNEEEQALYDEGYNAYFRDKEDHQNPYNGMDAEYWSDGWEDAQEDVANDE